MDALTCGNKKAGQLLAELDDCHGIGLITRIHQGLGKPDKIYVHKCIVPDLKVRGKPGSDDGSDPDKLRDVGTTQPEVLKGHVQRCRNDTSGGVERTRQEVSKGSCNDTEGCPQGSQSSSSKRAARGGGTDFLVYAYLLERPEHHSFCCFKESSGPLSRG